ncbi:hypothetical protein A176_005983 [Myxococcus hansupus]|uniref:Uncharacterized protein n=1 Tax=Pseudomyxococcus hansupus TaxID=1297742 RepID=A0A0H4X052_9BACT|nr:hypothetical protein A176_005983 [Myxococcus hansupus]
MTGIEPVAGRRTSPATGGIRPVDTRPPARPQRTGAGRLK